MGRMSSIKERPRYCKREKLAYYKRFIYRKHAVLFRRHKISAHQITDFTAQLATLFEAGVPLIGSIEIIAHSVSQPFFRQLLLAIKLRLQAGDSLAQALRYYPAQFDTLYCNLVANGEESGTLSQMLQLLANYREKMAHLKGNLQQALIYPCCVFVIATIVTIGLLVLVVPRFQSLFQSVGAELPLFTQGVLQLSNFLRHWGWVGVLLGGLIFILARLASRRWANFNLYKDRWRLKLPYIGNFVQALILARMTRTLAMLFAAGMPLVKSLHAVANIAGNVLYQQAMMRTKQAVSTGIYLHQALHMTQLFPKRVIQMVTIGEQSGTLDPMLLKLAEYYEDETDKTIAYVGKLLEPIILLVISVVVGSIMVAMYLPLLRLSSAI